MTSRKYTVEITSIHNIILDIKHYFAFKLREIHHLYIYSQGTRNINDRKNEKLYIDTFIHLL